MVSFYSAGLLVCWSAGLLEFSWHESTSDAAIWFEPSTKSLVRIDLTSLGEHLPRYLRKGRAAEVDGRFEALKALYSESLNF